MWNYKKIVSQVEQYDYNMAKIAHWKLLNEQPIKDLRETGELGGVDEMLLNGIPRVDYQNASEFLNRAGIAHDPNLDSTIIMSEDSDSGTGTVSAEY